MRGQKVILDVQRVFLNIEITNTKDIGGLQDSLRDGYLIRWKNYLTRAKLHDFQDIIVAILPADEIYNHSLKNVANLNDLFAKQQAEKLALENIANTIHADLPNIPLLLTYSAAEIVDPILLQFNNGYATAPFPKPVPSPRLLSMNLFPSGYSWFGMDCFGGVKCFNDEIKVWYDSIKRSLNASVLPRDYQLVLFQDAHIEIRSLDSNPVMPSTTDQTQLRNTMYYYRDWAITDLKVIAVMPFVYQSYFENRSSNGSDKRVGIRELPDLMSDLQFIGRCLTGREPVTCVSKRWSPPQVRSRNQVFRATKADFEGSGKCSSYVSYSPRQSDGNNGKKIGGSFTVLSPKGIVKRFLNQGILFNGNLLIGNQRDIPLIGDYDGDGKPDLILYTPGDPEEGTGGYFTVYPSSLQYQVPWWPKAFGKVGDIPLLADIDGDGHVDLILYSPYQEGVDLNIPKKGFFKALTFLETKKPLANQNFQVLPLFGLKDDIPIVGDFDQDGFDDVGLYTPVTSINSGWGGFFSLWSSHQNTTLWPGIVGKPGDIPMSGNFIGNGKSQLALFSSINGELDIIDALMGTKKTFLNLSQNRGYSFQDAVRNIPFTGDYDCDGKLDLSFLTIKSTVVDPYGGYYSSWSSKLSGQNLKAPLMPWLWPQFPGGARLPVGDEIPFIDGNAGNPFGLIH